MRLVSQLPRVGMPWWGSQGADSLDCHFFPQSECDHVDLYRSVLLLRRLGYQLPQDSRVPGSERESPAQCAEALPCKKRDL